MLGSQPSPPPWTEGMTDACENITLPHTSFADAAASPSIEILSSPDLVPQMETLIILNGNESCLNGRSKPSKYHDIDLLTVKVNELS